MLEQVDVKRVIKKNLQWLMRGQLCNRSSVCIECTNKILENGCQPPGKETIQYKGQLYKNHQVNGINMLYLNFGTNI